MRSFLKYAGIWLVLLALLGACTGLPGATAPGATQAVITAAPAATEAPGSTQAAPLGTSIDTNATSAAQGSTEMPVTASPAEQNPTALPATTTQEPPVTSVPVATTVPEPTMPPAPTAEIVTAAACTPGALTPAQTEGPYYKANPPESSSLLQPGMNGTKLTITGYVLDAACQPVPGARVDFWQADSEGQYDNQGYTLRGYEVTGAEGRYSVETVVPGLYPGRTRHIHVKITPLGGRTLTTQLYFPGEAANGRDQIFSSELVMHVEKTADGELGTFDFVIKTQ